jgi:hypothetical protein
MGFTKIHEVKEKEFTMFPAEYRTWQGETRLSHSLLGVAQLAHASAAQVHERMSQ